MTSQYCCLCLGAGGTLGVMHRKIGVGLRPIQRDAKGNYFVKHGSSVIVVTESAMALTADGAQRACPESIKKLAQAARAAETTAAKGLNELKLVDGGDEMETDAGGGSALESVHTSGSGGPTLAQHEAGRKRSGVDATHGSGVDATHGRMLQVFEIGPAKKSAAHAPLDPREVGADELLGLCADFLSMETTDFLLQTQAGQVLQAESSRAGASAASQYFAGRWKSFAPALLTMFGQANFDRLRRYLGTVHGH